MRIKDYDQRLKETRYDLHCCIEEVLDKAVKGESSLDAEIVYQVAAQLVVAMNLKRVAELLGDETYLISLEAKG